MKYIMPLIFLALLSCNKSNETITEPIDNKVPFLVDTLLLNNGEFSYIETPLVYEDKLIIMTTNPETKEGWISCYNKHTRDLLWTWREALDDLGVPAKGFGNKSHIYNGILCIAQSNLSYGINVDNGKTIWKNRGQYSSLNAVFGHENTIASFNIVEHPVYHYIKVADCETGTWRNIYDFIKDDTLNITLGTPLPFSWNNQEYVTFLSIKWSGYPSNTYINKLNLYNLSTDQMEWISDTIPLHQALSGTPGLQPKFEDGQILLANDAIYSYNVEDGSLEWWKWYGNSFVISTRLTTANNNVYANNASGFFVGLNVHTGEELFNTPTGSSASNIEYHNGKCYMSSLTDGSKNRLMVIDGYSGTIIQNILAPFRSENIYWIFNEAIAVDPETGLVFTGDHKYLLIYDFEE